MSCLVGSCKKVQNWKANPGPKGSSFGNALNTIQKLFCLYTGLGDFSQFLKKKKKLFCTQRSPQARVELKLTVLFQHDTQPGC